MLKKTSFKAFTLAEVLITLGVIGIVVAMTLPALIGNYQKKVLETRYKRSVAVISNAVDYMMAKNEVYGDMSALPIFQCQDTKCIADEFASYIPTVLKANFDDYYVDLDLRFLQYKTNPAYSPIASAFFPPAYAGMVVNGQYWNIAFLSGGLFVTNDGAYYGVIGFVNEDTGSRENPNSMVLILDVNGAQSPNIVGHDFFELLVNKHGKVQDMTCLSNGSCLDETWQDKFADIDVFAR